MKRLSSILVSALATSSAAMLLAPAASAMSFDPSSYADAVVDYSNGTYGAEAGSNANWAHDPNAALGAENWTSEMTTRGSLGGWNKDIGTSLGQNGFLTVEFTDNYLVGGGDDAADLWIFEIGSAVEAMKVEISTDNETWYEVGIAERQNAQQEFGIGMDIDARIAAEESLSLDTLFRYVRVTDGGTNKYQNSKAGADIDAIAAISSVRADEVDVPEPTSLAALFAFGLAGVPALKKRKQSTAA